MSDEYLSWGRYPRLQQRAVVISDVSGLPPREPAPLLPRGNGRSYGDSCLVPARGTLIDLRELDRQLAFNTDTGVLRCEAGMLLAAIHERFTSERWCLPVSPGTRLVTVGGAIANDVHGKNHHRRGSFGNHVLAFELVRSNGERLICSPDSNAALFFATIGGLGLTGFITWADIQLARVKSVMLGVESIRFAGIDEFEALSQESDAAFEYTVAWIDCLAPKLRGIFTRANHLATSHNASSDAGTRRLRVPMTAPVSLVNHATLKLFNELYFHRPLKRHRAVHMLDHLYPLDAIDNWNRIYGPKGLQQYQCVIPPDAARDVVSEILATIARHRAGSFLAVLKRFGAIAARGLLSFPRPGWTLAMDFPMQGENTIQLFDALDTIVLRAGGALYPAKDAHMSAAMFQRSYPQWRELDRLRDPQIMSAFWLRVTAH